MPQMAPLSWMSLFIMFTFTLIMFSIMNFYKNYPNPKENPSLKLKNKFYWKW
uniref:ATP synthase F0 subunit 8 n=1 Tax=Sambus femoralis TaxID=2946729 RepID=UPI002079EFFF|nr:ATP synthase F0 subunit 8 [Sambus femoralis]URN73105.1 ATP synthase F0 subunit 8 [Sambus femoralis]